MELGEERELSELKSEAVTLGKGEMNGKGTGRPELKRAAIGARTRQSSQDLFRRGNGNHSMHFSEDSDVDAFTTPGKPVMRGILARSLSAAASSPQQVGTAQTLTSAEPLEGGIGRDWRDRR